ncbi:unnamed protein product [Euphydryas editha]|uniref:Uncharacterized protein n=1 Tax=Euphydryas editha TaxID=104508 RepID=A0AAU9V649_EUPED|nr:unnamed protein product [Euphydryas editha]
MEAIKDPLSAVADMFKELQELEKSTSSVTAVSLSAEFNHFKMFIMTSLTTFQRQVAFLGREIDCLEMRKRRKMILLHGIEEDKSEDTTARVTSLVADHLDLPTFSSSSINCSHRHLTTKNWPQLL